jgi:putative flippase GtrA
MPVTAFLLRLSDLLPPSLRLYASEERIRLFVQFVMFAMVGLIGLVADTATVYALRHAVGLYAAGIAAYFTAATVTWFCNRSWTFRHANGTASWHLQWRRFLLANFSGFIINRGVYALLVTFVDLAAREPVIAVFAGAVAGMTLNFNLSRKLVFR